MSAHNYQEVYDDLGIDLKSLGCIMLKTEVPDTSFIKDEDLYYTDNPKLFWVNGRSTTNSHITLKYGLLNSVRRKHVDTVIDGLPLPERLIGQGMMKFDSPYPDEPYECIVLKISTDSAFGHPAELMALHNQLNYLPHVNTFPDYKPHVTLAYVRKGWYSEHFAPGTSPRAGYQSLKTTELDYGRMR